MPQIGEPNFFMSQVFTEEEELQKPITSHRESDDANAKNEPDKNEELDNKVNRYNNDVYDNYNSGNNSDIDEHNHKISESLQMPAPSLPAVSTLESQRSSNAPASTAPTLISPVIHARFPQESFKIAAVPNFFASQALGSHYDDEEEAHDNAFNNHVANSSTAAADVDNDFEKFTAPSPPSASISQKSPESMASPKLRRDLDQHRARRDDASAYNANISHESLVRFEPDVKISSMLLSQAGMTLADTDPATLTSHASPIALGALGRSDSPSTNDDGWLTSAHQPPQQGQNSNAGSGPATTNGPKKVQEETPLAHREQEVHIDTKIEKYESEESCAEEEVESVVDGGTASQVEELEYLRACLAEDEHTLSNFSAEPRYPRIITRKELEERIGVTKLQLKDLEERIVRRSQRDGPLLSAAPARKEEPLMSTAKTSSLTISSHNNAADLISIENISLEKVSNSQRGAVQSLLHMHDQAEWSENGNQNAYGDNGTHKNDREIQGFVGKRSNCFEKSEEDRTPGAAGVRRSKNAFKEKQGPTGEEEVEAQWEGSPMLASRGTIRIFQPHSPKDIVANKFVGKATTKVPTPTVESAIHSSAKKRRSASGTGKRGRVILDVSDSSGNESLYENPTRHTVPQGLAVQVTTEVSSPAILPQKNLSADDVLLRVHDVPPTLSRLRQSQVQAMAPKSVWDELSGMGEGAAGWHYVKALGELEDWWYVRPDRESLRGGKKQLLAGIDYFTSYEECQAHVLRCMLLVKGAEAPSSTRKSSAAASSTNLSAVSGFSAARRGMDFDEDQGHDQNAAQAVFRSRSSSREVRRPSRLDGNYISTFDTQQLHNGTDSDEPFDVDSEGERHSRQSHSKQRRRENNSPKRSRSPAKRSHRGYDRNGWNEATQQQELSLSDEEGEDYSSEDEEERRIENKTNSASKQSTARGLSSSPNPGKEKRPIVAESSEPPRKARRSQDSRCNDTDYPTQLPSSRASAPVLNPLSSASIKISASATKASKSDSSRAVDKAVDNAESFLFAGMVFYLTGFSPQELEALAQCVSKHRGRVDSSPTGLKERLLASLAPSEDEAIRPSQLYDEPEEVMLLSTPKAYRREKFLLALASLNGMGCKVVPTHAGWVWDSVASQRKLDITKYALPLGASQLRPFARTMASYILPPMLTQLVPLPMDTIDRNSECIQNLLNAKKSSKSNAEKSTLSVSSVLQPRVQGILAGLTFVLLAVRSAEFDWVSILLAAGAARVIPSPSESLLQSLAAGETVVNVSMESGQGILPIGGGEVIGLVDPLVYGNYRRSQTNSVVQSASRKNGKKELIAESVPILNAVHGWITRHSQGSHPISEDIAPTASFSFRVLSLEWLVQCLTCGVRLYYDDEGYEAGKDSSAVTYTNKSSRPLNSGTFRLPLDSELQHLQVYYSTKTNERYMVQDVVLINLSSQAASISAAGSTAEDSRKRKASPKDSKEEKSSTSGYKMGKIVSFVTTEMGDTAVKVRVIEQLASERRSKELSCVELSSSRSLVVPADALASKALILRRADYDALEYIQVAASKRDVAAGTSGDSSSLYCASETWEANEEPGDVSFAKRYHPHLFCENENTSGMESDAEDEWRGLPLSQDY